MNIQTERLIRRPWRDSDHHPFVDMSEDPTVMEFMLPLKREQALGAWIDDQIAHMQEHGFCFWAAERKEDAAFVGTVGLRKIAYNVPFTPRLAYRASFGGHGYAPEAAAACLQYGFDVLELPEIMAITVPANCKSRRVMEKLGMQHDPDDDFDHPRVPHRHPLRRHVLYRLFHE
ncbi:GNAT family N-acetyltransferase [Acetobacter sp.]|uniref:GNAT family N-acetyltransferase n=1 Tax=Acetobacter sp. TaxID=440 RepID=UPI0039E82743